jgi:two-component system NarL family sensor kinase
VDDGKGFDSGAAAPDVHLGLANMRDRASRLGGTLEVESGSGGTTIIVLVPMIGSTADRPTDQEEATR